MKKKGLSIFLALAMCVGLLPTTAMAAGEQTETVGIYLRTLDKENTDNPTKSNFVDIPADQLSALGLAAYYNYDTYGYWVDYGSFSSEKAATYSHEKQDRNSDGVKAVIDEITSDNVTKKGSITMALPTDNANALTWDTLSWSDNGGSYSWHLNGELHVCKVHLDLNYEGADNSDASLTRYALVGTDINSGLPTPTLSGYNFTGWYTEKTGGTKITSIPELTDDITYYAHWQRRSSGTGEHTHYLCGGDSCTHVGGHTDEPTTFTAWDKYTELPTESGAYYLTTNVTFSRDSWQPADGIILCLNGHTITRRLNGSGYDTFSVIGVNQNHSFTLTDCQIIPGTITGEGSVGRGIYMDNATFTMYNGNITEFCSGGVYVFGAGDFKMYGGSINNCENGVYVPYGSGNVQISGGSIKDNTSCGIYYKQWIGAQTLKVNGNTVITGNGYGLHLRPYSSSDYIDDTGLHVSGAVQIKDNTNGNVRFYKSGTHEVNCVYVDGALDSSARIGITTVSEPTTATTVAQATTANAIKEGNFTSDQDYQVILDDSGKIVQFFKHVHNCDYTSNNSNSITATCKENDYSGSIQINAPTELEYNGEPKAATLDTTDWELDTPKITYTKNGEAFDGVPTDIGTYTASITLGDATATTSYEITKKVVAIDTVTAINRKYDPNSDTVDCDVTFADNANLVKGTDYTVVGTIADKNASTNPKDVDVTVTLINPNYTFAGDENTTTSNTTVSINKADGDDLGTTNISQRYNDTNEKTLTLNWEQLPTSSWNYESRYTADNITLSKNDIAVDGSSITYALPENGGNIDDEITFTITAIDNNNNYENFTQTIVLHLTDKNILTVKASDITTTYTGNAVPDTAITGTATFEGNAVEGTWSFESETNLVNVADSAENVSVVFTPAEADVYAIAKDTIQVTINKATPSGTPEYTSITTSDRTLADAELRVGTITPEGTIAWNDDNATVVEANKAYGWTFTPNDTANYETLTGNITPYVVSSSSSGGGHSSRTSYAVSSTAADNGAISSNVKTARKGDTVTITVQPESGYKLDKLTVTDANGNALTVTDKGDGTYTFTMPNSKVEITPTFVAETTTEPEPEPTPETNPFTDVHAEDYFFDAVKWAADKNITGGIDTNLFGPNMACTRAQIVTFLWRAAGSPAAQTMNSFSDVAEDAYYAKAVAWAVENGITNGTSEDTFSPDLPCTRAQSMTFLYRASKAKAPDGTPAFSDVAADAYYATAVKWATENNITSGMGNGLFGPDYECTRAQIVTFLYRLYTK